MQSNDKRRRHLLAAGATLAGLGLLPAAVRAQGDRPFVIATNQEPDALDLTQSKYIPSSKPILDNVFESLVGVSPAGTFVPELATGWTTSADGREFTFKLRQGVLFHSGDPFTARDVVFSHERMLARSPHYQRIMKNFQRLDVLGEHEVRFVFKATELAFIPTRMLSIVSRAWHEKVGEERFAAEVVGTGAWRLGGREIGKHLDLAANERYWGARPPLKAVRFVFVKEDTTRVAMLRAGEADFIFNTPFAQLQTLAGAGLRNVSILAHPTPSLIFNLKNRKAPWADVRVRRALAHAIDVDAVIKGPLKGVPKRYARLGPDDLGYDAALKPYAFDPQLARKLLAEAGHARGFTMPLAYFTGVYTGFRETAEAIAIYLKAVGVEVKLQGGDGTQMIQLLRTMKTDANADTVLLSPAPGANSPEVLDAISQPLYSKSAYALYESAEFDRLYEQAAGTVDEKRRGELTSAALRVAHEDVATIPMWSNVTVFSMKRNVDFTPTKKTLFPIIYLRDLRVGA